MFDPQNSLSGKIVLPYVEAYDAIQKLLTKAVDDGIPLTISDKLKAELDSISTFLGTIVAFEICQSPKTVSYLERAPNTVAFLAIPAGIAVMAGISFGIQYERDGAKAWFEVIQKFLEEAKVLESSSVDELVRDLFSGMKGDPTDVGSKV